MRTPRVEWVEELPSDLPDDLAVPGEPMGTPDWLRCFDAGVIGESLRGRVDIRYAVLRDERGVRALMPVLRAEETERGHIFRISSALFGWIPGELESPRPARRIAARVADLLVRGAGLHSEAPLVATIPGPGFVGSPARRPDVGRDELVTLCSALTERARDEGRWLVIPGLQPEDPWTAVVVESGMKVRRWWSAAHLELTPSAAKDPEPSVTGLSGNTRRNLKRRLRKFRDSTSAEGISITWTTDWGEWAGKMRQLNEAWAQHRGHEHAVLLPQRGFERLAKLGARCLLVHRKDELLAFVVSWVRGNVATPIVSSATPAFLDRDPSEATLLLISFTLTPYYLAREGVTTVRLGYNGMKGKVARGGLETVSSLAVFAGSRRRGTLAAPAYLLQDVKDTLRYDDGVHEDRGGYQGHIKRLADALLKVR